MYKAPRLPAKMRRAPVWRRAAAATGFGTLALSGTASAAEYCVSCLGPDAHYVCAFDGVEAADNDPRLKLLCITELARTGAHASCSVDRTQKMPCAGERKVLATPDGMGDHAAPAAAAPEAARGEPGPAPGPADAVTAKPTAQPPAANPPVAETTIEKSPAPPKTVQEAVDQGAKAAEEGLKKTGESAADAAKSAGSAFEKAGSAIGSAAKKTWECLSTFFGSC
jgi:hypothetical protein